MVRHACVCDVHVRGGSERCGEKGRARRAVSGRVFSRGRVPTMSGSDVAGTALIVLIEPHLI